MEENTPKKVIDYSKAVAPLLTVLGISVGAWQFTSQMSHESKMEFSAAACITRSYRPTSR